MAPTLLQYGPISTMNTFLAFYLTHHSLDDIPNPTIRIMEDKYPTVEERTKAMYFHTTKRKLRYTNIREMSRKYSHHSHYFLQQTGQRKQMTA